jgi:hypothetical protein
MGIGTSRFANASIAYAGRTVTVNRRSCFLSRSAIQAFSTMMRLNRGLTIAHVEEIVYPLGYIDAMQLQRLTTPVQHERLQAVPDEDLGEKCALVHSVRSAI